MRRASLSLLVILLTCTVIGASSPSPGPSPSDAEVKVALQSILVASAASMAARNFMPPLQFAEADFQLDSSYASASLRMEGADIGSMRQRVLAQTAPPPRQMGFFEALMTNVVKVVPDHERLIAFLVPQALLPAEVMLTGTVSAQRYAAPYPFRYEGSGTLQVSGTRFGKTFQLDFSFMVPLEGPSAMAIIPVRLRADDVDYLHVAKALFPAPLLPDGQPAPL